MKPIISRYLLLSGLLLFSCAGTSDAKEDNTGKKPLYETNPDGTRKMPEPTGPGAELLKAAEEKFRALDNYSAGMKVFTLRGNDKIGEPFTGEFFYAKGKYHIDLGEDLIICDGDSIMYWYRGFGTVEVVPVNYTGDLTVGGMYKIWHKANNILDNGMDGGMHKVTVLSSDANDVFSNKIIWVDPASGLITKFSLLSNGQTNSYLYELSAPQLNSALDAKLFVIDKDLVARIKRGEVPAEDHHGHDH